MLMSDIAKSVGQRIRNYIPPSFTVVVAQALCILTAKRDDHRPHVAVVMIQFIRDLAKLHLDSVIGEQTVGAESLCSRSCCDVVGVGLGLHHLVSIIFQSTGDELGSVSYRWLFQIVLILQHLFTVGKVFYDFLDELLLLLRGWREPIGLINLLHALTGSNVFCIRPT